MLDGNHKSLKRQLTKIGTKNKGNKQKIVTNMIAIKPTISVFTLNINDINASIKTDCQSGSKQYESTLGCQKKFKFF